MSHTAGLEKTAKYLLLTLFLCSPSFAQIDSGANTQKEVQSSALNKSSAVPLDGQIIVDPNNPSWLKYNGGGPFFLAGPGDPEGFLYRGALNADGTRNGDLIFAHGFE